MSCLLVLVLKTGTENWYWKLALVLKTGTGIGLKYPFE